MGSVMILTFLFQRHFIDFDVLLLLLFSSYANYFKTKILKINRFILKPPSKIKDEPVFQKPIFEFINKILAKFVLLISQYFMKAFRREKKSKIAFIRKQPTYKYKVNKKQ